MTNQITKPAELATKSAAEQAPVELRPTKIGKIIALLERKERATLDEIVEATGDWQPHATRAALTGVKKKGHTIERNKRDEKARYLITRRA